MPDQLNYYTTDTTLTTSTITATTTATICYDAALSRTWCFVTTVTTTLFITLWLSLFRQTHLRVTPLSLTSSPVSSFALPTPLSRYYFLMSFAKEIDGWSRTV